MKAWLRDVAALVATALRGLRSRLVLTVGSVLLTAIAVAAAIVGPMYQSASAASYLVTQLRAQPDFVTGLTIDFLPATRMGSGQARERAERAVDPALLRRFESPSLSLWTDRLFVKTSRFANQDAQVQLLAEPGICHRLVVTGRCPTQADESLLLQSDAAYSQTEVGDRLEIAGVRRPLTIVGTYRLPVRAGEWFDPSRFGSVLPFPTAGGGLTPYYPAPLIVAPPTVTTSKPRSWFVRMDYRLPVPASTTLDDVRLATQEVTRLPKRLASGQPGGSVRVESGNALKEVARQAQSRRDTARQTVTPAVVSLILVALVLLVRLLSATMDLRRPELAVAALRGVGRRQLWALGMLEPVLMLVMAAPIGVAVGFVAARSLGAAWLVPGLPIELGLSSVWFAIAVLVACLLVAALTVRSTTAEPLSVQIAAVRRPTRSPRWIVLLRLALIAAAVAVLAATFWSGERSKPTSSDLLLPILLAVAAGLLTSLAAALVARWWAKRSADRRGVAGYVASRTIARRREGTLVILPLAAALAIAVFAAGIYAAAANWRASAAATMVGADTAFPVRMPISQAVRLTHQLDPAGRWMMAAAVNADSTGAKVIVDAPRLARVAVWPASWTPGMGVSQVGRELSPIRPPLTLTGRRLQVTLDNDVQGRFDKILLTVEVLTASGQVRSVFVGPYPHGRTTKSGSIAFCKTGCQVTGLSVTGPGTLPQAMRGALTISSVRTDGASTPYFTRIGWRAERDRVFVYGARAVVGTQLSGSALTVDLDTRGRRAVAMLTPQDVPPVLPVLMGRTADPEVVARHGDELVLATSAAADNARVQPIATSESVPFLGPAGMLIDYTMYTRTYQITGATARGYILARSDTPQHIVKQLAAHGITEGRTLQDVRQTLEQDAYALALKLYLVVTVIVILLALAGLAVNMAVQIPARRRDAASLRVVGLARRSILRAVASEFTAVLSTAAIAGILAGALSQYVVVRTITLGFTDNSVTPRVLPVLDIAAVAVLLGAVLAGLLCLAIGLGGLTVRGARTATLRESAA